MVPTSINLADKLNQVADMWSPKVIADMEGLHFKLVKLKDDFIWHKHPETDEAFLVVKGQMRIDFRDGAVTLNEGEMLVVPSGVEHKPFAESECHVMVLSRQGTVNTGDAPKNRLTTDPQARI